MRPAVLRRLTAILVAVGLLASLAVSTALAASISVTSLSDITADDGFCTLREAITSANTDTASGASVGECAAGAGPDLISFGVGVAGTITLGSALPNIASDVTIDGDGSITVDADGTSGVFAITSGTVNLLGLTITGGVSGLNAGGIFNAGVLTVSDSTISENQAAGSGGGILNGGTMTITNSTVSGNFAGTIGGGIENGTTMTITNSTISGNTSGFFGGGIFNGATLTVTNSTISGNSASFVGGGIDAVGTETLVNAIVAGNTAGFGQDLGGPIDTATTSIIGVPVGLTLADILVPGGPVDNGGPTLTIALTLVAGNPAIDAGTGATCAAAPVNALDQRGLPRPAACDIGAYEAQPPTVAAQPNVSATATSGAGAVVTYTSPAGTDEQGGTAAVACLPASGSTFPVGSTTVTCTATDAVGHTGSGTFAVNVAALAGSPTATAIASPTPTPTATPGLLPNTASGSGTNANPGVLLTLGLLGLGLVALGLTYRRDRRLRR